MPTGAVNWDLVFLIVAIISATAAATWWVSRLLNKIFRAMGKVETALRADISALREHLMEQRVDQAYAVAEANPGFKVPDPRDLRRLITVSARTTRKKPEDPE
jgi:hypothetical protein